MSTAAKKPHGGPRANSGRPRKPNPEDYIQVTVVLRKDTVEALKAGAGGKQKFFGGFLQFHLDRFPIPSHEEYLAMKENKPAFKLIKRSQVPVIFGGNVGKARRGASARPGRKPLSKELAERERLRRKFLKEFEPV